MSKVIDIAEVCENADVVMEVCEELAPKRGIVGKIVLAVVGGVSAIGAGLYLTRNKREAFQIKQLEKKGYVIYKDTDAVNMHDTCEDDSED
jgi:uncharacterized protein (UPF0264 family)